MYQLSLHNKRRFETVSRQVVSTVPPDTSYTGSEEPLSPTSSSVSSTTTSASASSSSSNSSSVSSSRSSTSSRTIHSSSTSRSAAVVSSTFSATSATFTSSTLSLSTNTPSGSATSQFLLTSSFSPSHTSSASPLFAPATINSISASTSDFVAATTLVVHPSSPTETIQISTFDPLATATSVLSAPNNGFWSNKGAVAGTFTVVSLVIVGCIIAFVVFLKRRSKHYKQQSRGDSEFFGGFSDSPRMTQSATAHEIEGLPSSPGSSIIDISEQPPMDPHGSQPLSLPSYYATTYATQGLASVHEHGSHRSLPFITPPVFARPTVGRTARNSYQPSVDSFYGAS